MAHKVLELDKGMSKGAPWHLRETRDRWTVTDGTLTPTMAGAIGWARQDETDGIWNPNVIQTFARAGGQDFVSIPGSFHVIRDDMPLDDPRRFISCGRGVGKGFQPITNQDIIDYANALSNGGAVVDSCGSICNGARVFFSMFLPNGVDIVDEQAAQHILLTTAHDGTACFEALLAVMLTVCWNTLQWNRRNAKTRYSIRHTRNATQRLAEAEGIIEAARQNFGSSVDIFRALARKKITDDAARSFVEKHFGDSKRQEKTRSRILDLYHGAQIGGDLKSRKGTLFGLVGAATEYLETNATIRKHKDAHDEQRDESEVRMASVLFGAGARKRDEMLNDAMEIAGVN